MTGVHRRLESAALRWLRGSLRLTVWCAAGTVVAAAAVAWTVAAVARVLFAGLATVGGGEAVSSAAAYLSIVTAAVAVWLAGTAARVARYHRAERRAEHYRWVFAQPFLDQALAETREGGLDADARARAAKAPKPALPRPLGMAVESGGPR